MKRWFGAKYDECTLNQIIKPFQEQSKKVGFDVDETLGFLFENGKLKLRNLFSHGKMSDRDCNPFVATALISVWLQVASLGAILETKGKMDK